MSILKNKIILFGKNNNSKFYLKEKVNGKRVSNRNNP